MWSLRLRVCPPCPRLPPLMVWVTWATSHTACRTWFQHCQDRTPICPPNSPTCQASSPCINRSASYYFFLCNQVLAVKKTQNLALWYAGYVNHLLVSLFLTSYGLFQSLLIFLYLLLLCSFLARWLPLVARSSSNSSSSRPLRLCRAARRHSSSPSTESSCAAGSATLHPPLLRFGLSPHSLDSEDALWKHTHTHLQPSTSLWCCGNVKYCDDVAELLLSLPLPLLKYGNVG